MLNANKDRYEKLKSKIGSLQTLTEDEQQALERKVDSVLLWIDEKTAEVEDLPSDKVWKEYQIVQNYLKQNRPVLHLGQGLRLAARHARLHGKTQSLIEAAEKVLQKMEAQEQNTDDLAAAIAALKTAHDQAKAELKEAALLFEVGEETQQPQAVLAQARERIGKAKSTLAPAIKALREQIQALRS